MNPGSEGMIAVPGGRVWYRIVGKDAPGVPLLVLHGGPGAPHDYLENLAALADERPVVFYDQLGCGRSERPDDPALWQLSRFVEELAAVRAALGLHRIHLLGQSWGTMLAVQALLAGAQGVERLVLSAPCLSAPRWIADQRAWLEQMPAAVRGAVDRAEAQQDFDAATYQEAMTAYYQKHLCRLDPWPDGLQRSFADLGQQVYLTLWGPSEFTCTGRLRALDLTPQLSQIKQPTLLTCGRFDEATPETVEDFCRLIPGARMQVFEEASHNHHLEQPQAYLTAVREFLLCRHRRAGSAAVEWLYLRWRCGCPGGSKNGFHLPRSGRLQRPELEPGLQGRPRQVFTRVRFLATRQTTRLTESSMGAWAKWRLASTAMPRGGCAPDACCATQITLLNTTPGDESGRPLHGSSAAGVTIHLIMVWHQVVMKTNENRDKR